MSACIVYRCRRAALIITSAHPICFPQVILGGFTNGEWNTSTADGLRNVAAVKLTGEAGDEVWRYQAGALESSQPGIVGLNVSYVSAVAIDGDDNVLLVGSSFNSLAEESDLDYLAIKLLGATGDEAWRVHGGLASAREGLEGVQVRKDVSKGCIFVFQQSGLSPCSLFVCVRQTVEHVGTCMQCGVINVFPPPSARRSQSSCLFLVLAWRSVVDFVSILTATQAPGKEVFGTKTSGGGLITDRVDAKSRRPALTPPNACFIRH